MNLGHAILGGINGRHTINPSIHVSAVETGKAECLCENRVKRIPVVDFIYGYFYDNRFHVQNNLTSAGTKYKHTAVEALCLNRKITIQRFAFEPAPSKFPLARHAADPLRGGGVRARNQRGIHLGRCAGAPQNGDQLR